MKKINVTYEIVESTMLCRLTEGEREEEAGWSNFIFLLFGPSAIITAINNYKYKA